MTDHDLAEPPWAPTLRRLWADPEISTAQIAARMGVGLPAVRNRADALGLGVKSEAFPSAGWTGERVELLETLWKEGLSCSQIAKQLRGVTRNAVIGKVHRMGLTGRATPSQPAKASAPKPASAAAEPHRSKPRPAAVYYADEVVVRFKDEGPGTATPLTLGPHMCKWPIGDPALPGFTHCGRRSDAGPYCLEHARVAYQPAQDRKKGAAELARSLRRYI